MAATVSPSRALQVMGSPLLGSLQGTKIFWMSLMNIGFLCAEGTSSGETSVFPLSSLPDGFHVIFLLAREGGDVAYSVLPSWCLAGGTGCVSSEWNEFVLSNFSPC